MNRGRNAECSVSPLTDPLVIGYFTQLLPRVKM